MKTTILLSSAILIGCGAPVSNEQPIENDSDSTEIETDWSQGNDQNEDEDETNDNNENDESDESDETEENNCPDSWVLTYALEGRVDITHTPLNIGNADAAVGGLSSDELVLRIPDDGGKPANGQALLVHFDLLQDFRVSVNMLGEIAIVTDLHMTSSDECGIASAQLQGSNIEWDQCNYGQDHGTNNWDPSDGAYGAGCISDYSVQGTVECIDESWIVSCEDGWLEEGVNDMSYIYDQPMLNLNFDSNELERFTMSGSQYGTELPTDTNNRIWLALEGTLKSKQLEPTPDCLCGN